MIIPIQLGDNFSDGFLKYHMIPTKMSDGCESGSKFKMQNEICNCRRCQAFSTKKDEELITKMTAISKVNIEAIGRINKNLTADKQIISSFDYGIHESGNQLSSTFTIYGLALKQTESKYSAKQLVDSWSTNKELQKVEDIFNDKLDYTCYQFDDIIRLNEQQLTVAKKFKFFDCTESAIDALNKFYSNYEQLQLYLGEIEMMMKDKQSEGSSVQSMIDELNQQIKAKLKEIEEKNAKEKQQHNDQTKRIQDWKSLKEKLKIKYKPPPSPSPPPSSSLTNTDPLWKDYIKHLSDWIPNKSFNLLYRGSRDGFGAQHFHSKCDNKGETLTIIKSTGGWLFGGYTPIQWTSRQKYASDNRTFIFTLLNPHNIPPTKFINHDDTYSICDHSSYGPRFGGGHDIYVSDNCNSNSSSYTNFPSSYTDTTSKGKNLFTGNYNFQVSEIEVYQVN
eukprot:TRINITY_DN1131_c0_g1_i6.p1 TRINITY_DN1131_c0_g1~~TRINITY_DN1131_c0_g1_i6.p1  ORF type:complete len:448 (-),score=126.73 TRINITY_DN1131_c0_g1_i6:194-1537(-)